MTVWKPLSELARAAGLPESTARRYARGVALPYMMTQAAGRFMMYDLTTAVPILRRVAELFRQGRPQEQVAEILGREFRLVVELEPADTMVVVERHAPPQAQAFAPALAEILTAYNTLRAELADERQARAALEQKLLVLEAELTQGKRRQREFERAVDAKLKR